MAIYTPPAYNAVNVDLKATGSDAVVIPAHNMVNVDLSLQDGVPPAAFISDNARLRNFAIFS